MLPSGRQAHHRVPSALPVVPRYRSQREAMRLHHAHRSRSVHRTRVQLRTQQRSPLQDNRSRLQGDDPSLRLDDSPAVSPASAIEMMY